MSFDLEQHKAKREAMRVASGCKHPDEWCGYTTCRSDCGALIHHGPGHQSKTHCDLGGPHDQHRAILGHDVLYWSGMTASTGFFDESPE